MYRTGCGTIIQNVHFLVAPSYGRFYYESHLYAGSVAKPVSFNPTHILFDTFTSNHASAN